MTNLLLSFLFFATAFSLRPLGNKYSQRIKHLFMLTDKSPSMAGDKINSINDAGRSSLAKLKEKAGGQERSAVELTVIEFASGAEIVSSGPVSSMLWTDVAVSGSATELAAAIDIVTTEFKKMEANENALFSQAVVILLTDGLPSDDWRTSMSRLLATEPGSKCLRLAIGIGSDVDLSMLDEFMGNTSGLKPLLANSAEEVARHIEFGSTILPFQQPGAVGGNSFPTLLN